MTHGICTSLVIDALIVGTTVTRKHHLVTNSFIWKESKLLLFNTQSKTGFWCFFGGAITGTKKCCETVQERKDISGPEEFDRKCIPCSYVLLHLHYTSRAASKR